MEKGSTQQAASSPAVAGETPLTLAPVLLVLPGVPTPAAASPSRPLLGGWWL